MCEGLFFRGAAFVHPSLPPKFQSIALMRAELDHAGRDKLWHSAHVGRVQLEANRDKLWLRRPARALVDTLAELQSATAVVRIHTLASDLVGTLAELQEAAAGAGV